MKTLKISDLTKEFIWSSDYKEITCFISSKKVVLKVETKFKFFQCVTWKGLDYYFN